MTWKLQNLNLKLMLLLMGGITIYLPLNPGHEIDMIFFSHSLLLINRLVFHLGTEIKQV